MRYKKYIYCAIAFVFVFGLRLHVDNQNLAQTKLPQESVKHIFEIKDDPQFKFFATKTIAVDENINKRVLVAGTGTASSTLSTFDVGDQFEAEGYFSDLGEYETYLKKEHIVGKFTIKKVTRISPNTNMLESFSTYFRARVTNGCARLSIESQGICEGLLIGEKSHISKVTYDKYKAAQLTHLLVASGANIVFILAFLSPVLKRLRLRPRFSLMCAIAIFYCILTRFEPSILRATIMVCVPSIGRIRGYRLNQSKIFISSIAVCLLIDPFLIYRVGFWLSTTATGGLYFLTPKVEKFIKSELVASTLAATLAVQPVLWISFGFTWPFKWPVSVMAIAIAEPLSTVGFVCTFITSYLDPTNSISHLMSLLMNAGCWLLNLCAGVGQTEYASYFGLTTTITILTRFYLLFKKGKVDKARNRKRFIKYYQ